jgi:hypothetical protein
VLKYPTGDTLHLPTSLLRSLNPPYVVTTEQMPVPGVPFPGIAAGTWVSWGRVDGTNIGYIYAMNWSGTTGRLFAQAVEELTHSGSVDGLILDFRTNVGGSPNIANEGFSKLFGFDPTSNYSVAIRQAGTDHLTFRLDSASQGDHFTPQFQMFHQPIAVLTGPMCGSAGDYNAFRLRFHPMVRFFGEPSAGAYTANSSDKRDSSFHWLLSGSYPCRIDNGSLFSNLPGEGFMIHRAFPVDEAVWLTREGVARGEDAVVQSAMSWIQETMFIRDLKVPVHVRAGADTVEVRGAVINADGNSIGAVIIVEDTVGNRIDSVALVHEGNPAGNIVGGRFRAPGAEGVYSLTLRTYDDTDRKTRVFPRVAYFNTLGPVEFIGDTISATPSWGARIMIRLKIRNSGSACQVAGVTVVMRSLDTAVTVTRYQETFIGNLSPGEVKLTPSIWLSLAESESGSRDVSFELTYKCSSLELRRDTMTIRVMSATDVAFLKDVPATWFMGQNYPNPFNSTTVINYQLPVVSDVRLVVYDLLGREVAVLVEEKKEAGRYEFKFDGSGLASGVYFCRLSAGGFVETKKMTLIR